MSSCCKGFFCFLSVLWTNEQIWTIKLLLHRSEYCLKHGWNLCSFTFSSGLFCNMFVIAGLEESFVSMSMHCPSSFRALCINSMAREQPDWCRVRCKPKASFPQGFYPSVFQLCLPPTWQCKPQALNWHLILILQQTFDGLLTAAAGPRHCGVCIEPWHRSLCPLASRSHSCASNFSSPEFPILLSAPALPSRAPFSTLLVWLCVFPCVVGL